MIPSDLGASRAPAIRQLWLLLGLGIALYLLGLGMRDLWYPDEPDVAEPVREMLLRGDWITPSHNGVTWIDYPVMIYWLAMIACKVLGGISEFALRLPSALAAIALAVGLWRFTGRRLSPAAGLVGALVLMTMPHFAYQATNIHPDMVFAAAQGLGLLIYAASERQASAAAWSMRILAFALFGVAFLAKGPLGLLLPGFVLTLWHLSFREWGRFLCLAPLTLATLAVAAPWYLLLARDNGADFVLREFLAQNFARFSDGATRGHLQPWHYYLTRIWGDIGLWSVLLPGALAWRFRARIWADRHRRLLWLWFVALFGFFTLAATKREVYLLPAYAALAALIGDMVAQAWTARSEVEGTSQARRQVQVLGWCSFGVAVLVAVVGLAAVPFLPSLLPLFRKLDADLHPMILGLRPALAVLGCVMAVIAWWLWRAVRGGRTDQVFGGAVAIHAGAWVVAMLLVFPRLDEAKSYRPAAEWLKAHVAAGDELGFHYPPGETTKRCGFLFYGGMRLRILATPDELAAWLEVDPRRLAVVGAQEAAALTGDQRFAAREIHRFNVGKTAYVVWGRRDPAGPVTLPDPVSVPVPPRHPKAGG